MQNQHSTEKLTTSQWLLLIPVILLLGLSPFFIKLIPVNYPVMPVDWRLTPDQSADLFTYGKHYLILTSAVLSILILFFSIQLNLLRRKENRVFISTLVGTLIIFLLSTLFSKFSYAALWGSIEKYEGIFIWISYLTIAIFIGWLTTKNHIPTAVLRIILFSGLIVTGIGFTQFLGYDIIRTEWFKSLIMPAEAVESVNFAFEANRVYSTLYNPNFVAMYAATIIPTAFFMCINEKQLLYKILWTIYSVLLVCNLIGSKNEGGLVGLAVAICFAVFLVGLKRVPFTKKKIVFVSSYALSLLVMILATAGSFNSFFHLSEYTPKYPLTNVSVEGFDAFLTYNGNELNLHADSTNYNQIEFFTQGVKLNVNTNEDGSYNIVSPDFSNFKFFTGLTEDKLAFISLMVDNSNWNFLLHPQGIKLINSSGVPTDIVPTKGLGGFVGHEQIGSARGYIWSRTLPLILASPIIGYGADNFTVAFPQKDYSMKYQVLDQPNIVIDKAHNFYLQVAMNFGIIGFTLLFILIGLGLYGLFNQFISSDGLSSYLPLVMMLSIFAYLGSGLFYDSNLHVSPFFWTFIGFGYTNYFKD